MAFEDDAFEATQNHDRWQIHDGKHESCHRGDGGRMRVLPSKSARPASSPMRPATSGRISAILSALERRVVTRAIDPENHQACHRAHHAGRQTANQLHKSRWTTIMRWVFER